MNNSQQLAIRLGNRIRDMRKARGITIATLAASAGVSSQTLSHIENGRTNFNIRTLLLIEQALNCHFVLIPDEDIV